MADKHPVSEIEQKPEESRELTPKHVMYAMSLISQFWYKEENEPRYEVHPQSCLIGASNPLDLTYSDVAEFFEEPETSEIKHDKAKVSDAPKDVPKMTSE